MSITHSLASGTVSGTDANDTAWITNNTPNTVLVEGAYIEPKTAVATHADNHITTALKKGSTTIASHTTDADSSPAGSAMVAGTPLAMTMSGTGKNLEIAAGGSLGITVTKAGTGPAYNFRVVAKVREIRTP